MSIATAVDQDAVVDEHPIAGARLSYRLLALSALLLTWTGVHVGGFSLGDWVLVLAVLFAIPAILQPGRALPGWVVLAVLAATVVGLIHAVAPTDVTYMNNRFQPDLGTQFAPPPQNSTVNYVQWMVALLGIPLVVAAVCRGARKSPLGILNAWAFGAAASGFIGLTDFFGVTDIGRNLIDFDTASDRQSGLASHANNLGFACAIAAPIVLHRIIVQRKVGSGLLLMLLLVGGTIVSGSRGCQVGAGIAIFISFAMSPWARRAAPPAILLALCVGVTAVAVSPRLLTPFSDLNRFGNNAGAAQSDEGRSSIAVQALDDFHHSPVVGIGFEVINGAHSIYLQLLASGGMLMFFGFLTFFAGALLTSLRETRGGNRLAPFLATSVLVWMASGAIENQLTDRYLYFAVGALAFYAVQAKRAEAAAKAAEQQGPISA